MPDTVEPKNGHAAVSEIQTLMCEIARALVDHPEAVHIDAYTDGDSSVLRLHVAPGDIGKVIGKQGRTARSLRTILGAASMKFHQRFALDIVESEAVNQDGNQLGNDD